MRCMSIATPQSHKTGGWPTYNTALKRCDPLTIWIDPDIAREAAQIGKLRRRPLMHDFGVALVLGKRPHRSGIYTTYNEAKGEEP